MVRCPCKEVGSSRNDHNFCKSFQLFRFFVSQEMQLSQVTLTLRLLTLFYRESVTGLTLILPHQVVKSTSCASRLRKGCSCPSHQRLPQKRPPQQPMGSSCSAWPQRGCEVNVTWCATHVKDQGNSLLKSSSKYLISMVHRVFQLAGSSCYVALHLLVSVLSISPTRSCLAETC